MTLHNPVSIALDGKLIRVEFPDGHYLTFPDTKTGWEGLRALLLFRSRPYYPKIGEIAEPVQHSVDRRELVKALQQDPAKLKDVERRMEELRRQRAAALAILRQLGLR